MALHSHPQHEASRQKKLVDVKSYELAEHFLDEHRNNPRHKEMCKSLAADIQTAVEEWFDFDLPQLKE